MNTHIRTAFTSCGLAAILMTAGCAGMSHRDKATAVGAGVGAVGGAVLTDGALGTLGGAAVGGVIGNQIGKKDHDHDHD